MVDRRLFALCVLVSACMNAAFWSPILAHMGSAPSRHKFQTQFEDSRISMLFLPYAASLTSKDVSTSTDLERSSRHGASDSAPDPDTEKRPETLLSPIPPKDEPKAFPRDEWVQDASHYVEVPPEFAPDPIPLEDTHLVGVKPQRAKDMDVSTDRLTDEPRMTQGRWRTYEMQEVPFIAPLLPPEHEEVVIREAVEAQTPAPFPDSYTSRDNQSEVGHESSPLPLDHNKIGTPGVEATRSASAQQTGIQPVTRDSESQDHVLRSHQDEETVLAVFSPKARVLAKQYGGESAVQTERIEPGAGTANEQPEGMEQMQSLPAASTRHPPSVPAQSRASPPRRRTLSGGLFRGEIVMDRLPAPLHYDPVANAVLYGNEAFNVKPDRYAPYYKYLRDNIGRYWFTMMASFYAQRGYTVERIDYVVIRFTIHRDGTIADVRTIAGSQDPVFESICLRSIQAARLEPLPPYVTEPELKIIFKFARPWP